MSLYTLLSTARQSPVGASNQATAVASGAYGTDVLAMGPWAYYRLGEAQPVPPATTAALDTSANGRHATYLGSPALGQAALVEDAGGDTAVRLQTPDSYVLGPVFQAAAATIVMTVELGTVAAPNKVITSQDQTGMPGGWSLECLAGKLRGYIRNSGGTAVWILGSTVGFGTLVAGQRHTVGVSFGAAGAELWIDSTRVAHDTGLTTAPAANTERIQLGSYYALSGIGDGFMDEAILFDRQLSAGEHAILARPDTVTVNPPPVAQDDPVSGRHAVTAGTAQQPFTVLANDTGATLVQSIGALSPNIGTAARIASNTQIGYTPPTSIGSATDVNVPHTVSGPGGTDTAVLKLTVNPVATAFGYPCLVKPGGRNPIFVISGDRNSSQTLLRQSDGADARYDCRTLIARVRNGGNTPASYKTAVIITSYGGCISGGQYLGENSFNTGWSGIYTAGTNGALEIGRNGSAGNMTVDNVYGYNTWDCLKVNGNNEFDEPSTFQGCYIEHNRDDAIENDGLMSMIVRDCLFDGCFVGFSQRLGTGFNPPGTHKSTYENTLVRIFPYKTGGNPNNTGDQGGPNLNPGHKGVWKLETNSPQMEVRNMIIAVQQDANFGANSSFGVPSGDILLDYKIEQQRGKVDVSTNNRIVGLGGYIYNKGLPPGWSFTSDDNIWWNARAAWLTAHPEVAQWKRSSMPSGLSLDQP